MIPFVDLVSQRKAYKKELENAEKAVLESGCYIGGTEIQELTKELSLYTQVPYVIPCASGTDAIYIALLTLGVKPGDEVIVPDFTFIAPAECVIRVGASIKFADIDKETLQIDPQSVEKLITPATKGIIAVNLFGQCAPFDELKSLAQKNNLWILEDSAQAFGATQNKIKACSFGDIAITSFYPTKPLGCYGDGGALFTHNIDYAKKAKKIANHGSEERYKHTCIGFNSRLDAIQAAVLRVKLRHLDDELKTRQNHAKKYTHFFNSIPGFASQKILPDNSSTFAQYTILASDREHFINILENTKIPYCIHYPYPLHNQLCFNDKKVFYCPNSELASKTAISLPVCAFTNVDEIIEKLKSFI